MSNTEKTNEINTVDDVLNLVNNGSDTDNGSFFSVVFTKRTTGEERSFTCRRGVRKYLKGGELKYDPTAARLMTVWIPETHRSEGDKSNGYRMVPVENISEIKANGHTYVIEEGLVMEVNSED